jgi:cysteine desulfurase
MKELYFDNASTTQVREEVISAINEVMAKNYGNPSSGHVVGDKASKIMLESRTKLARAIGAKVHEIYFTSGTTESNNWIFSGLAHTNSEKKKILISSIEHPSIRETANLFKQWGYSIIEIPVSKKGFVDIDFIEKNIDNMTLFVSIIHTNNIFGTIQNLKKIGDICKRKKTLFHTDCAQSFGKMKILVHDWNIDLLSTSAHKINGPKGIGFLYVRDGIKFSPIIYGGGQERNLRSGTENLPGIVGFMKATELSLKNDWFNVSEIRDYLTSKLEKIGGKIIGASGKDRICNNIFVSFSGLNGEDLMYKLSNKGIYVSTGSACETKKEKEDSVLVSLGLSKEEIKSSIRISLPYDVSKKDADYFIKILGKLI